MVIGPLSAVYVKCPWCQHEFGTGHVRGTRWLYTCEKCGRHFDNNGKVTDN